MLDILKRHAVFPKKRHAHQIQSTYCHQHNANKHQKNPHPQTENNSNKKIHIVGLNSSGENDDGTDGAKNKNTKDKNPRILERGA